jgi:hypothetical protein
MPELRAGIMCLPLLRPLHTSDVEMARVILVLQTKRRTASACNGSELPTNTGQLE